MNRSDLQQLAKLRIKEAKILLDNGCNEGAYYMAAYSNVAFQNNWSVVKDWSEQRRYDPAVTQAVATDLYNAIISRRDGVLPWLKKRW